MSLNKLQYKLINTRDGWTFREFNHVKEVIVTTTRWVEMLKCAIGVITQLATSEDLRMDYSFIYELDNERKQKGCYPYTIPLRGDIQRRIESIFKSELIEPMWWDNINRRTIKILGARLKFYNVYNFDSVRLEKMTRGKLGLT